MLREYVWLEDTPLAMFDYSGGSPATFFIHTGQIGEPLAVTNAAKAKVWDAAIEPFGQAVMFGPASEALDLRLPGQWAQAETGGLFQNWMRDYDPTLGRYAQADPLGIEAGENLYAYALGSPLALIDPTGEVVPLAGALFGGGLDLIEQLAENQGRIECVNWWRVGANAALGAVGGAAFRGVFRITKGSWFRYNAVRRYRRLHRVPHNYDVHHWAIGARSWLGRRLPDRIVNHPWNLHPIPRNAHRFLHNEANDFQSWMIGVPGWAKAAQVSVAGGLAAELVDKDCRRCR